MRLVALLCCSLLAALALAEPITIRMMAGAGYGMPPKEATDNRSVARRAVFEEFHRQNPDVRVVNAGGLEMVGDRAESMFLMSMAGTTAPDVFYVNFRQYYNYIDQGFCRPLDDLIARDPEAISRANPIIMDVIRSYDGQVYAVPWFQVAQGLYYRKDHFLEAGLDPSRPPRTWDEFYEYAKRLSQSKPGRTGFVFSKGPAYHWTNFLWQAGGEVVQPGERGLWKSAVATPEAAEALEFFRKLMRPTRQDERGNWVDPPAMVSSLFGEDIRTGRASMWFGYTNDVVMNTASDLNPALLGVAAMPAGPAGPANEINAGMWAINATITDPKKIEACWRFIKFFAGDDAARINTERFVELGLGNLVNPQLLKRYGFEDLAQQVDPAYVQANEDLFSHGHPEPYGRNTQQVYVVLDSALDRAVLEPRTPALKILQDVAQEMDRKLLGYTPTEVLQKQRAWGMGILISFLGFVGVATGNWYRRARRREDVFVERLMAGADRKRIYRFMLLCLLPAGLSILVWSYYPLLRGLIIAFQDYRIIQGSSWVGLDNFIAVFTQPIFWKSLWNSFVYVGLSILIGFFIPIFLALALNEIPRAKVFFRTVFYLPAMTSPIVIAFLWRQFYDKSPEGLLNTILAPFINALNVVYVPLTGTAIPTANDWLGNPSLAMFAVVLPGIWAGAGPGSILYLAALKNIAQERYEAADIDGASWWHKIRYIVVPGLKPLILINLLGVFIAGFKAMENIFVLTGGGPLYSTHTIGLEVWTNAFMFLKFGYATAAAWVMGAILIGFTLIQIRNLLNMRFSTAKF
jgi:ABC-type sugar transport system permease subunit/ABC-type glycerol-3-phosphate transport system substrate-binding protein